MNPLPANDEFLLSSQLRLEELTREVFRSVRDHLATGQISADNLYLKVRSLVANCLQAIVVDWLELSGAPRDSRSTAVFFAPRYRRWSGPLFDSSSRVASEDATEITKGYGVGTCGDCAMPVAFWSHAIYEVKVISSAGADIQLAGYSKWMSKVQSLYFDDGLERRPIVALHAALGTDPHASYHGGVLTIQVDPSLPAALWYPSFREKLYAARCVVASGAASGAPLTLQEHPMPVYEGPSHLRDFFDGVFSAMFYANFRAEFSDVDWLSLAQASHPGTETILRDLRERYETFLSSSPATPVCFSHYYTLLLNPGFSFSTRPEDDLRALGTMNLYTNVPLPQILIPSIAAHVESAYRLLRDLEEWTAGAAAGGGLMNQNITHEVKKVSNRLLSLVTPVVVPSASKSFFDVNFSPRPPQPLSSDPISSPTLGTITLYEEVPPFVAHRLGVTLHVPALLDIAYLFAIWFQSDDPNDVRQFTRTQEHSTFEELANGIWSGSLRLLPLMASGDVSLGNQTASLDALVREINRLDGTEGVAQRTGLRLAVLGDSSKTPTSALFTPVELNWLARALIAILRDKVLYAKGPVTLTFSLDPRGSSSRYFRISVEESLDWPTSADESDLRLLRANAEAALRLGSRMNAPLSAVTHRSEHHTVDVVRSCLRCIRPLATASRDKNKSYEWALAIPWEAKTK